MDITLKFLIDSLYCIPFVKNTFIYNHFLFLIYYFCWYMIF
jgi:hypothetical protein